MRVDKLYLPNFRNLVDFEVDFDESSPRCVVIGRNAVGKTNILEALTLIFKQLDLRQKASFPYRVAYTCNGKSVVVEAIEDVSEITRSSPRFSMKYFIGDSDSPAEKESFSEAAFYRINDQKRILPRHVFGYYSGTARRLVDIFSDHTQNYRDELIAGREDTIRPLFLAEDWHSQFVLLAFYAKHDPHIREFLQDQLGIEELESVLFILNEPHWYNRDPSVEVRERGDERYWWATGTVKRLFEALHDVALAPIRTRERIPMGIKRYKTKEISYCYIKSPSDLRELASGIDQKEFFKRLESTVLSDLLKEVRIRFRVKHAHGALTFADLSEGEQQLLTVLGLLRFTNQDESLFLLDEPDTHLNPAWCLDYLDILTQYGGGLDKSQIIMTTHNPLVFAGLKRNEVVILKRDHTGGKIEAEHPTSDPKGMGIAAILTSEFFGLRSTLDRETLELLDEKRELGNLSKRTQKQEARLEYLNGIIRGLDFTSQVRDPLYAEFVRAMTDIALRDPEVGETVLSQAALQRRRQYAAETLARLKQTSKQ